MYVFMYVYTRKYNRRLDRQSVPVKWSVHLSLSLNIAFGSIYWNLSMKMMWL